MLFLQYTNDFVRCTHNIVTHHNWFSISIYKYQLYINKYIRRCNRYLYKNHATNASYTLDTFVECTNIIDKNIICSYSRNKYFEYAPSSFNFCKKYYKCLAPKSISFMIDNAFCTSKSFRNYDATHKSLKLIFLIIFTNNS